MHFPDTESSLKIISFPAHVSFFVQNLDKLIEIPEPSSLNGL